jgi:hypothetical protein
MQDGVKWRKRGVEIWIMEYEGRVERKDGVWSTKEEWRGRMEYGVRRKSREEGWSMEYEGRVERKDGVWSKKEEWRGRMDYGV